MFVSALACEAPEPPTQASADELHCGSILTHPVCESATQLFTNYCTNTPILRGRGRPSGFGLQSLGSCLSVMLCRVSSLPNGSQTHPHVEPGYS